MDYEKAMSELDQGSTAWKPGLGIHTVTVLGEPEPTEYKDDDTGKVTPQLKFMVEVNSQQLEWYVGKGKTSESLYGQLMVLGKANGKLTGEVFTLIVKTAGSGEGIRKSYTIPEAVKIMQKNQGEVTIAKAATEQVQDGQPPQGQV